MTALPRILTAITFQSTPSVWRETLQAATTLLMAIVFQSTPSVWRETWCGCGCRSETVISIHSLRVEGDADKLRNTAAESLFQSTPSVWRETVQQAVRQNCTTDFNPLPPCGGRRATPSSRPVPSDISIHSLRVEGDRAAGCPAKLHDRFQSTPSVWRETGSAYRRTHHPNISIHSLRVEGDR